LYQLIENVLKLVLTRQFWLEKKIEGRKRIVGGYPKTVKLFSDSQKQIKMNVKFSEIKEENLKKIILTLAGKVTN